MAFTGAATAVLSPVRSGVTPDVCLVTGLTLANGASGTISIPGGQAGSDYTIATGSFASLTTVQSKASRRGVSNTYAIDAFVDIDCDGAPIDISKNANGQITFTNNSGGSISPVIRFIFPRAR